MSRKILDDGMASMISDKSGDTGKVVLLGASGRLGGILRMCWPNPADLISHSRYPRDGFVSFDQCLEPERAVEAIRGASNMINLSGVTPAHAAVSGDSFALNTDLACAAVTTAKAAGVRRVFLISSAAVYGQAGGIQHEDMCCYPVSDYGRSKLGMERAAVSLAKAVGQAVTVVRIGNVAGADAILGNWQEGMQIDQLPDGSTPRRSYIGPETLTRIFHELTQATDLPDILNLSAPGSVAMGDLLNAADLAWSPRPAADGVIANVTLSTQRLEGYITFAPQNLTAAGMVAEWRRVNGAEHKGRT